MLIYAFSNDIKECVGVFELLNGIVRTITFHEPKEKENVFQNLLGPLQVTLHSSCIHEFF